jgi:hypothetical protein
MSVTVVTLLVDPLQAESLMLAVNEGHIQLVLRNSSDQKVDATARRELRDLYSHGVAVAPDPAPRLVAAQTHTAPRPETRVPVPAPVSALPLVPAVLAPPAVDSIILIRGNQKTVETFPAEARNHDGGK